uniref:Uncharacterized protein n=1 Tax=Arundo donax TaxID=35708 RepID=A0A0A9BGM1_ARUDO
MLRVLCTTTSCSSRRPASALFFCFPSF